MRTFKGRLSFMTMLIAGVLPLARAQANTHLSCPAVALDSRSLGTEARPARVSVKQNNGAYAVVDFIEQGIVHVATSGLLPAPSNETPIFTSPMLIPANERASKNYPTVETINGKSKTQDLELSISQTDLGVEILDSKGRRIARIKPANLRQPWKDLEIETEASHAYGLGEYPRGTHTDEPWLGGVARTDGEHGNIMSPFFGGVQTYTQFPVVYGTHEDGTAFAVFVDTPYKIEWNFTKTGTWKVSTWGDELRYFVMTGKDLQEVHKKYLSLVGKAPVPPRSVLGTGISKFGYRDWADVDHDIAEMHQHGLPVGMVSLDLYWFGGDFIHHPDGNGHQYTKMGALTPDPVNFPNFSEKVAELKRQGTDVMLISESYVNANLPEAQKLLEWGCVVKDEHGQPIIFANKWWGSGYMIDWTNPSAKEWIKLKYVPLAKMGIRNFWFDLGEPEAGLYAPNGRYYGVEPGKNNHGDIHNVYNLMWVKSFKDVMDEEMPNQRFYMMNRSGTSGLHRFGAGKWGGDTGMSVMQGAQHPALNHGDIPELIAHLQNRIKNMPLVGVDYYTSDVGGFHRWALNGNQEHRDLGYTVWYANSALLDMPFRPHLWIKEGPEHDQTNYLPTNTGHVDANVANTRLRAELEPYYYQAAHRASADGTPIIAPLYYYHPSDPNVREMGHEAYIGQDLLMGVVANIYEAQRNVYLPHGGWYDYHTNQFHPSKGASGQWLYNFPLKRDGNLTLPLFAREGAIIPLNRITSQGARISEDQEFRVRVFAGETPSEKTIIDDDGESHGHQNGDLRTTLVRQQKTANGFDVTVSPSLGSYGGASAARSQRVELIVPFYHSTRVQLDGQDVKTVSSEQQLEGEEPAVYVDQLKNRIVVYSPARTTSTSSTYSFQVQ